MSNASYLINQLNESINSFENRVDGRVNSVYHSSEQVHSTAVKMYESINQFKENMMRGEQSQIAQENILRIDQEIREKFANYDNIRKTVMGIVRDFDINLVRNSTIQDLSEELWISSSRYWLSYALIAITAWVNNYPDVAKNAISESTRKDSIKTSLFFCLMNLRFERYETARKWFLTYLEVLDPNMLQQETAVLLQAFLNGIFGKDKELEHDVLSTIDEWIRELNADAAACKELVEAYSTYIKNMNPLMDFPYTNLAEFCTNCTDVRASFRECSKFDLLIGVLQELDVDMERQDDSNYKARVDAVLMNLISNYDSEELKLRNQQAYFRYIVANEGNIEAAQTQYDDEMRLLNEKFNIGKQFIRWAVYDSSEETDVYVRKFALKNTKVWFQNALECWDAQLRDAVPVNYSLAIDGWEGTSNGRDHAEQIAAMKNYFETNKFQNMYINTINIALLIAIVLSIGMAFASPYALVVTVLAAAFLVFRVMKAMKEYPLRVNAALTNLDLCMQQITDFETYFADNRKKKETILRLIDSV